MRLLTPMQGGILEKLQEIDFDFELLEFDLPIEIDGFDLGEAFETTAVETEISIIKRYPRPKTVKYERAVDLVKKMPALQEGEAMYAIVSGNFIFGDFIEAFMVENNFLAEEMLIATLSLGQENVDSLKNLQEGGYAKQMSLIVSDYWYAHERRREGGVPYIIENLGGDDFRFAAAGLHTKVTIIKTACGKHFILHGSANLRSSRNIEQFCIENNEELYKFNSTWMEKILCNFTVTKKSTRGEKLWQTVTEPTKKEN